MGLRVSTVGLYRSATRRVMENVSKLQDAQEGLASGKRIRSAGDNPAAFGRIVSYKSLQRTLDQYQRNISSGRGYLDQAESSLQSVANLLARARELAMQGASDGTNPESLAGIAAEVGTIQDEILSLANASWSGGSGSGSRYLFSGYRSDTPAFSEAGIYQGDESEFKVEIAPGDWTAIGLSGRRVFQGDADVFSVLADLKKSLEEADPSGTQATLDGLDRCLSGVSGVLSEIGARTNRLDQSEVRLEDMSISLKFFISQEEDLDLVQAASQVTLYQAILNASIQSAQAIFDIVKIL